MTGGKDEDNKIDTKNESGSQSKKQISSYHLYSNDNLGNIITQVQLRGENYDEWARAIRG